MKAESATIVSTLFCSFLYIFFCIHLFLPFIFFCDGNGFIRVLDHLWTMYKSEMCDELDLEMVSEESVLRVGRRVKFIMLNSLNPLNATCCNV